MVSGQPDGLFAEPRRIDWKALAGTRTSVALSWGDVECIVRGSGVKAGEPYVEIELCDGEHKHEGPCELVRVSPVCVTLPLQASGRRARRR